MRRKQAQLDPAEAHAARLAWWAAFVTTVILVVGLSLVHTADAASGPAALPQLPATALLDPEEAEEAEAAEEGELEEEECEIAFEEEDEAEEEGEEGLAECELEEEDESTPPQCRLESADAAVSADLVHGRLHLALRYTASRSSTVGLKYWLRGSRGPLTLPAERSHFGRNGVFHASQRLTDAQAKKVAAAKSFTIQVRPAGAPGYCHEYLDQSLTVRRGGQGGPMWIDSESTFRRSRHA